MSSTDDRVIHLVRVSQRDGNEREHSPDVQRQAGIDFAQRKQWLLDPDDIWDENVDTNGKVRDVSGGALLAGRPRLAHAVAAIEAGTHRILLAQRFDRLFRNVDVQREVIRRVEAAGGEVWAITRGRITHGSASGKMLATMEGAATEFVKDTAQENSKLGVQRAIEQGHFPGPIPPGYWRKRDKGEYVGPLLVDSNTVEVVREAFGLRDGGASVRDVQAFLAANGIKRTQTGVRKMLASRLYVGEIHYGDYTPNLEAHEPIIDRDVFERVQKMKVSAGRKAKSERLLARLGVLHCGSCGGRMSISHTGPKSGRTPFYRCASQEECSQRVTISAEPIEARVIEEVKDHYRSMRGRASAAQSARQAAEAADKATATHADFVAMLDPSEPSHVARELVLRDDRDRKREAAERTAHAVPLAEGVDVDELFESGTLEAQRNLIRATVEVTVYPGRGSGRVRVQLLV